MRRIVKGVTAALLLVLLLVGLPVLLVQIWSVGLPHVEPTPAGFWAALLRPDDGTLFLTALKVVAWIVWAVLVVSVVTELVAVLRRIRPRPLPGLALPQGIARGLVAATLALFINTNSAIGQPAVVASAHAAPLSPAPSGASRTPAEKHPESGTAHYDRYTVKKGDTLSEIALEHLGNARRYPAIFKASRDIRQPLGYRLTDPDVIDIGWKLRIPPDHKRSDKPATKSDKKPEEPQSSNSAPTTRSTPVPSSSPATSGPTQNTQLIPGDSDIPQVAQTGAETTSPDWLLTGLAGAGAILAGSLWLVLLRRRAVQAHHRQPGYVTAPPPPPTIPVEKTLRHQGQPVGDLLTAIDENLRRLAMSLTTGGRKLPRLIAVASSPGQIELHLADATTLDQPWQSDDDQKVWRLTLADLPTDPEPLEPDGPAPWPHLATIGADDTARWWLVNLEAAGITAIDGDPDYAADLARYLAAELATSPWSRDINVDLMGIFEELAGLDPQRLRHHTTPSGIDDTLAASVETIDRLNHLQLDDLAAARASQAGDEIWPSRVVVTRQMDGHFGNLAHLINTHPGQTATAALIVGSGHAATPSLKITVGADGRVRSPALQLDLIANGITADEAAGCVQLLKAAEQLDSIEATAAPGGDVHKYGDQTGRLRPTHTAPRDTDGCADPAVTNLPQPDVDVLDRAATTSEDLAILAPAVPEPTRQAVAEADLALDDDLADWFSTSCARPRLSVIGPMRLRVGASGQPSEAAKRRPYYTELVAYLATRPTGATTANLCSAFATTPARIHRDLAVVRKWLGADPTSTHRYLPDAFRASGRNDGHGRYQLNRVLYDADLFRRLRLRGQVRGSEGLEDYMAALALVSGPPYSELRAGGGIWLADDRDDQHLIVAIVDTAHLAVTMALQVADIHSAHLAATTAANAAPDDDTPKLDLAQVAAAQGEEALRDQLIAGVLTQRNPDGPLSLAPRTGHVTATHRRSPSRRTG